MTKTTRAKAIELLRCAADGRMDRGGLVGPIFAGRMVGAGIGSPASRASWMALAEVSRDLDDPDDDSEYSDDEYRVRLLEAAQRLSDGWSP